MAFWRYQEIHVLVHIIVRKSFLRRYRRTGKTTEKMRRCEAEFHSRKVHTDAGYNPSVARQTTQQDTYFGIRLQTA
jgi:hypothetical protein